MSQNSIFSRIASGWRGEAADPEPVETSADIEKRAAVPTGTIGSSRLTAQDIGQYVFAERDINLTGANRFDVYDEMVKDLTIVATGVRLFLNIISNAVWTVNPPEEIDDSQKAKAQEYADTAYGIIFDMTTSWATVVRKTASYRLIGFSVLEWTAKRRDDGVIGFLDIENRPQRTITGWVRDRSGTVQAVKQRISGMPEVVIPRGKIVYAVDDLLNDEPEGTGLFRHLAETADRLREFHRLEEVGLNVDLRGVPVARAPLDELRKEVENAGPVGSEERAAANARRAAMLEPIRDFLRKHVRNRKQGMLLPSEPFEAKSVDKGSNPSQMPKWAIELLSGDATSFDAMANAIKRLCHEMALVLGCEHLLLGSDGGGSLALAQSKVGTFYMTVTSTLLDLCEIFDRDVLRPLAEMNGWEEELRPRMGVNEITERDVEKVFSALLRLSQAGAPLMPDDPAVGELYDLLGLTRPPERNDDLDLGLRPKDRGKPEPKDPDKPQETGTEDRVEKRRVLKSRRWKRRPK